MKNFLKYFIFIGFFSSSLSLAVTVKHDDDFGDNYSLAGRRITVDFSKGNNSHEENTITTIRNLINEDCDYICSLNFENYTTQNHVNFIQKFIEDTPYEKFSVLTISLNPHNQDLQQLIDQKERMNDNNSSDE